MNLRNVFTGMRIFAWTLMGLIAMATIGCNSSDSASLQRDTRQLAETAGKSIGNAKVAASVNTVLSLTKGVTMSGLHVESEGGVVTLGGHVRNEGERLLVIEIATRTRGVDKVVDHLRVAP